jgi:hypothetical protein
MEQFVSNPFRGSNSIWARARSLWRSVQDARAMAAEFAALNALSDADLHRMGLTRAVLRRHIKQKHTTRSMLAPGEGWHDPVPADHDARPR